VPLPDQPLVSVVTPVYNGADTLAECVQSVLAQTYAAWELCIYDNGSTDASPAIAAELAARDGRVRLKRQEETVDPITNWNRAFRHMAPDSRYCKVVHADDQLFPECIERMVELAERHPDVAIVSSYRLDGAVVNPSGVPLGREVIPGREVVRQVLLGGPDLLGAPTSVLLRSDDIRSRPQFYPLSHFPAEDKEPCFDLLADADYGFVHQVLTYNSRPPDSQSAFADRARTWLPGQVSLLCDYGPAFLGRSELTAQANRLAWGYTKLLGKRVAQLRPWRDPEFAAYHRRALELLSPKLRAAGADGAAAVLHGWGRVLSSPRSSSTSGGS
jgi:glycosyltransferase involved in cell wall biosynthesis